MRWPRIIILTILFAMAAGFLHYTLPQRDVVRIVETDNRRIDFSGLTRFFYSGGDSGGGARVDSRDVLFIRTRAADGDTLVYRNEDTGLFGWPPYFKTRSDDWQTRAADMVSTEADPRWVVVTHYGWRFPEASIFPNAVSIREVDSPDVQLIPWLNIVILAGLVVLIWLIWRALERFQARVIDPVIDRTAVRWAKTKDWIGGRR